MIRFCISQTYIGLVSRGVSHLQYSRNYLKISITLAQLAFSMISAAHWRSSLIWWVPNLLVVWLELIICSWYNQLAKLLCFSRKERLITIWDVGLPCLRTWVEVPDQIQSSLQCRLGAIWWWGFGEIMVISFSTSKNTTILVSESPPFSSLSSMSVPQFRGTGQSE
jgi:hypothetical protein